MSKTLSDVYWRLRLSASLRLPDTPVHRRIRGVDMLMPRRHGLPLFAREGSPYAENLVDLGRLLHQAEGDLCLLDVGANVGDSALLVLDKAPGCAVCVEPDPGWLRYLEANAEKRPDIAVEPSVLLGRDDAQEGSLAIVHHDIGTSQITRVPEGDGLPSITTDELLRRHPQLAKVRLVKSDTDGYDVMLVPDLVRTFLPSKPVVFFEFDPRPTRISTPDLVPNDLFAFLVEHDYVDAVVWDNVGRLLGSAPTAELAVKASVLDLPEKERGYGFWDVAVAHRDDAVGRDVLNRLGGTARL